MIRPVQLPPPVRPGDRVGVAALSGAVDPEKLDAGLRALRELGFQVVEAENLRRRQGLFAGSDEERLSGFHRLAADSEIKAIFFARGGWGVMRLLDGLDWELLGRHPRAYIGYSDLTPLLTAVIERLGLAAFHGPMVAADLARGLSEDEEASLLGALAGDLPVRLPFRSCESMPCDAPITGPLLGGCLSLLVSALGTPWAGDLDGAMLFIEDLNEPPYRFDRMLTHLRLSDTLIGIRSLLVGHLHAEGCQEPTAFGGEVTLGGLLADVAIEFPWPLVTGVEVGHASPNLTLPLGLAARLLPAERELVIGLPWSEVPDPTEAGRG